MTSIDSFKHLQKQFWLRCFDFRGKTARKPFWIQLISGTIIYFIFLAINYKVVGFSQTESITNAGANILAQTAKTASTIVDIIISPWFLISALSLQFRRLRDSQGTGWWILLYLIPGIGLLCLLYMYSLPSKI